jgi:UDP-3-O-[3-hydroxymyristoyl] glucosamine N-acyltransferase
LIIAGGIGIAGDANIGGNVSSSAEPTVAAHLTNKAYVDSNVLAFSMAFGV